MLDFLDVIVDHLDIEYFFHLDSLYIQISLSEFFSNRISKNSFFFYLQEKTFYMLEKNSEFLSFKKALILLVRP